MKRFEASPIAVFILSAALWRSSEALLMKKMMKSAMMMGSMMKHDMSDWSMPLTLMPPDWHYTHQTEMDIHPTIVMNAIPNGKTSAVMVEDWHSHMPPLMMSMKPSIEKKETMTMMKMMTKMKDGAEMAHEVADQKMRMHISMHAANDKPPTAMTVETSRPPCKVNQISGVMTVTPNTEPVMARPEMISAPLMAVPPQMMQPQMVQPQMVQPQMIQPMQSPIQQPVMMMPTNNAFPSNVMASRMDRRA